MMKTRSPIPVLLVAFAAPAALLANQTRTGPPVTVSSPDGRTRAELSAADGVLRYRIFVDGDQVLAPSRICPALVDHVPRTTRSCSVSSR